MEIFIILIAAGAFWYYMMHIGQKAVRVFVFLCNIADDHTASEANEMASRIDLFAANNLKEDMLAMVNSVYGGSQLSMISDARLRGFSQ